MVPFILSNHIRNFQYCIIKDTKENIPDIQNYNYLEEKKEKEKHRKAIELNELKLNESNEWKQKNELHL